MSNQPMKTSPLVEPSATNFQPIGTFPPIIHEVPGYQPIETSLLCGTNPYMGPEPMNNSPMDTHNTPEEVEKAKQQDLNLPNAAYSPIQHDDFNSVVSRMQRNQPVSPNPRIKYQSLGISTNKLFEDTAVTISLAELFRESPNLRQREELYLAGTGAPRTEDAINKRITHVILDGGA
ncbi:hypothetical protein DSO57_1012805 [Entomophthora muscae]|uniref:Uncharacterized protein n=1 Tax=Entomophthora muscae TaxID=34485 RepID=A0ACC2URS1_9FUNG|nr:hypothetical protein DSO57_1012805 [Entomophthora muscae]